MYYFSSSVGKDSNNCTTADEPCESITKLNSLSYHPGDTVAFLGGDVWTLTTEGIKFLGANSGLGRQDIFSSAAAPITITTYGGGRCIPVDGITTGCATFKLEPSSTVTVGIRLANVSNVTLKNIVLLGGTTTALGFHAGSGVYISNSSGDGYGITLQNVEIKDFATLVYIAKLGGSLSNVFILNNHLAGSSPTATVDNGIWVRFGVTNSTIQGNLVENIGAHDSSAKEFYKGGSGALINDMGRSGILRGHWLPGYGAVSVVGSGDDKPALPGF